MEPKNSTNSGKSEFTRKPSFRRTPVIKQTITSMLRIAKANPLLLIDNPKEAKHNFEMSSRTHVEMKSAVQQEKFTSSVVKPTKASNNRQTILNGQTKSSLNRTTSHNATKPSQTVIGKKKETNVATKNAVPPVKSNPVIIKDKIKTLTRKSLSADYFSRKLTNKKSKGLNEREETKSLRDVAIKVPDISPIIEEKRTVTFKTPNAYKRRSVAVFTPDTCRQSYHTPYCSTPNPALNGLEKRLYDWLKVHGKPLKTFHHLKCFGMHSAKKIDVENKENIDVGTPHFDRSSSYEDLRIASVEVTKEEPAQDLLPIATEALQDLHKLIIEGYPHEQCEAWIGMIRKKCRNVDEYPQYWECQAAIEQAKGNITSAVEHYRTAILHGAEVKSVDESLEQLLEKFSLLNISTSHAEDERSKTDRKRIILDARNAFKSTIIQFAVRERTLKKKETENKNEQKRLVATPVRRSTRNCKLGHVSTPYMKVCSTLEEIGNEVTFENNKALSARYF